MTEERAIEILGNCRGCMHLAGNKCIADGRCFSAKEFAIKALQEIEQYRTIGTVTECREAMEKQRAKKLTHKKGDLFSDFINHCPVCGEIIAGLEISNYCHKCGQRLG